MRSVEHHHAAGRRGAQYRAAQTTRLRRTIRATSGAQIRMTRLPGPLTEALRLVDELAR